MKLVLDVPEGSEVVVREASPPISEEAGMVVLAAIEMVCAHRRPPGGDGDGPAFTRLLHAVAAYEAKIPERRRERETGATA